MNYYKLNITQRKKITIQLFVKQNGLCAKCKRQLDKTKFALHKRIFKVVWRQKYVLDHNHKTGFIRGVVCISCNGLLHP